MLRGNWVRQSFAAGCAAALLLVSCSSSGQAELDVDGPEITAADSTDESRPSELTETTVDVDRAQGLPVEPPSTTFSTDPDEQEAADVVYLYWALISKCGADLEECDPEDFRRIATDNAVENEEILEVKEKGFKSLQLDFEPEIDIRWIKLIDGDIPVMQVLTCVQLFTYGYEPDATPQTAEISSASLGMNRVIFRDGRWQFDAYQNGASATPDVNGEKACQMFDGEPQEEILEILEEGPRG